MEKDDAAIYFLFATSMTKRPKQNYITKAYFFAFRKKTAVLCGSRRPAGCEQQTLISYTDPLCFEIQLSLIDPRKIGVLFGNDFLKPFPILFGLTP